MLTFYTDSPAGLLKAFEDKIALGSKDGGISTWTRDTDGDFIHQSAQLKNVGYLKATVVTDGSSKHLSFAVKYFKNASSNDRIFAFKELTGNLLATFIDHFTPKFDTATYEDRRGK